MSDSASSDVATALLGRRNDFKAFIAARLGNAADAEDVLQNGLVKAIQHAGELKNGEKSVAWFYQILRRAIIDHSRSRGAARKRDDAWASDAGALAVTDREAENQICRCFESLLPALKPAHADLLRRVELQDESVATAARTLGITANNASVTLHRARTELRAKLVDFCGTCADGACLDCDCNETEAGR